MSTSNTSNGSSQGGPGNASKCPLRENKPTPKLPVGARIIKERQVDNSSNYTQKKIQLRMHHTKQDHISIGVSYQTSQSDVK